MAVVYKRFLIQNTQSVVDVYWLTSVNDFPNITNTIREGSIAYVGPGGSEIPYVYAQGAWHTTVGDSVGAQGAKGDKGDTGIQGIQGPAGATGAQGIQGGVGATGAKGDTGAMGATGPRGLTGANGSNGAVGPQGPSGPTGPRGIQGVQGAGVPSGGTNGQVLAKASDADNDTVWTFSGGGGGAWGGITGDIANQTDLIAALAAKADEADLLTAEGDITALDARVTTLEGEQPTAGELAALVGTSGTPGSGNKYVTNADSRNSDARTPTAHAASHGVGQSDAVTVAESQVTGLVADLAAKAIATRAISAGSGLTGGGDLSADRTLAADFGTAAGKVCQGNDARLSDTRTPTDNSVTTAKIVDANVTLAKIVNISATSRILGRKTAGAGVTEECTLSQVLDFVGSAADGDILYRTGGVWARLAKGTDGQALVLASGVPSWGTAVGDLVKVSVDVNATELAAINTTPKVLVAAKGANTIIHPVSWTLECSISVAASNAPAWNLAYANAKTNAILASLTLAANATGHKFIGGASNNPSNPTFDFSTSDPRNQNLVFRGNSDVTGITGSYRVHLVYTVLSTI
jgi:hypothetical protein